MSRVNVAPLWAIAKKLNALADPFGGRRAQANVPLRFVVVVQDAEIRAGSTSLACSLARHGCPKRFQEFVRVSAGAEMVLPPRVGREHSGVRTQATDWSERGGQVRSEQRELA